MRQKVQMPPVDEQDEFDQLRQSRHLADAPLVLRRQAGGLTREPDEERGAYAVRSLTHLHDRPTLRRIMCLFSYQTIGRLVVGAISALWLCLPLVHNSNDDGILTNQQLARQLYRSTAEALWDATSSPDTADAGMQAARTDLQYGIRKYMAYGLFRGMDGFRDLQAHGFEILFGGCLTGRDGFQFWMGYNEVMRVEMGRLHVANLSRLL